MIGCRPVHRWGLGRIADNAMNNTVLVKTVHDPKVFIFDFMVSDGEILNVME